MKCEILHEWKFFYTSAASDASDKYQLWVQSMCLVVTKWVSELGLWNLIGVTLADEDTNQKLI